MSMWKRLQQSTRRNEYVHEWATANKWGLSKHLGIIRFFRGHPDKRTAKIIKKAVLSAVNRSVRR